jgi:uncharacterized protein
MPDARPVNEQNAARQLSIPRLLLLHLAPGALATALFILLADPVQRAGFPPLLAFLIAIVVVIVPAELGVVVVAGRQQTGAPSLLAAVPYRRAMSLRDWVILLPGLLIVAIIGFGALSFIEPTIRDALFGWLPIWFRELIDLDGVGDYSTAAWTLTLALYVVLNVFIGPVVEELYFRGYLLPRMSRMGRWAPMVNTVLFSLYHFWSPWAFFSRVAGVAPFAYAVRWKENVYLGMALHVLLNAIGTSSLVLLILGKLG